MCPIRSARVLLAGVLAFTAAGPVRAEPADIPALIDRLVEVSDGDIGYTATASGTAFLQLDVHGQPVMLLLGQGPLVPSDTLRQLVKRGTAALPHLIAHLDDRRPTKVVINPRGFINCSFSEYLDRNQRTDGPREPDPPGAGGADAVKELYTLTVGDLCFVAIGQIVNRWYDAASYFPTGNAFVSMARSPALRAAVRKAWGGLTPERHRASLVADFLRPDDEGRRLGACKRLAYYYPDALEPIALAYLARPTYDPWTVQTFVREELYGEADPMRCRALLDAFVARHGKGSRDGVLVQLLQDLKELEESEPERGDTRRKLIDRRRRLLTLLYGKPKGVKVTDPPEVEAVPAPDKARLIEEGLIYDHSAKIDRAVRDLLATAGPQDPLGGACTQRLVGRGYDAEIEAFCRRATDASNPDRMQEVLDQLGWTPLHVAVSRDDLDSLRELLSGKARVGAAARNGRTPLHLAAANGNREAVRLLVDAGAPCEAKDGAGRTPAQLAAREDQPEVVRFLAARGCSTPDVLSAAAAGRADVLDDLLRTDPAAVGEKTRLDRTPLHVASQVGEAGVARMLLARGAAVDARDRSGWTPLHLAAEAGSADVARVLIRSGADVRARVPRLDFEPLDLAARGGHLGVAEALLDGGIRSPGVFPLAFAARSGHADMVDLLLKRGAPVDGTDSLGRTPLHWAAGAGQVRAAERLLAAGAKVGAKDRRGITPLDMAIRYGHPEMARLLEQHAARPGTGKSPP